MIKDKLIHNVISIERSEEKVGYLPILKVKRDMIKKSVAIVLINKDGDLLAVSRKDDHNNYSI